MNYYFISGLPRSGSTLLSAILRQNPKFHSDVSSPIQYLVEGAIKTITESESDFIVTDSQRLNTCRGIFDGFYSDFNKETIFDTSRKWTRRTHLLRGLFPYTKILCMVRDIKSIVNSFESITSRNYTRWTNYSEKNIVSRCMSHFDEGGMIMEALTSLQEGYYSNPNMIQFIDYDNLSRNPERVLREIYEFLEKPYYPHDFDNVIYSNEKYDMMCGVKDLHTIRKRVEYVSKPCLIPPPVLDYINQSNFEFWK
tara:strand:+ start:2067 stop:2825 length:759 start_codon:yes stop_codon:yes gene_type:complete